MWRINPVGDHIQCKRFQISSRRVIHVKAEYCAGFDDVKGTSVALSGLTNQLGLFTAFTGQAMDKHTKSLSFLFVWIIKEIAVQI